jgi:hypothetical protein
VSTSYRESNAVRGEIVVLDGDGAPEEIVDTLLFPLPELTGRRAKVTAVVVVAPLSDDRRANDGGTWPPTGR